MTGIVLATANAHKATELAELLAERVGESLVTMPLADARDTGVAWYVQVASHLVPPPEIRGKVVVVEDGTTFRANAERKAKALSECVSLAVLADDSGLEVAALNGAPGVTTARYAGPNATDADNVAKLLHALDGKTDRRAAFVAELVLRLSDGSEWNGTGVCKGTIACEPRGENGFGYDPVFIPREGDGRTFGEMSTEEKHRYSHRAAAFAVLGEPETWKRLVTGVTITEHPPPDDLGEPSWQ
ncbi:MAG: RdgB/HAM1 family non-canonical purine NTP pyrophosphatase [Acidimicrobiia bacterium]